MNNAVGEMNDAIERLMMLFRGNDANGEVDDAAGDVDAAAGKVNDAIERQKRSLLLSDEKLLRDMSVVGDFCCFCWFMQIYFCIMKDGVKR